MIIGALSVFLIAFLVSLAGTAFAKRYALRLGLMDAPGHRKVHTVSTPRNGGIGIFWGFALPVIAGLIAIRLMVEERQELLGFKIPIDPHYISGLKEHSPLALIFLLGTFATHVLGLLDDRKAMNPWPKLLAQLAIAAGVVLGGEFLIAPGAFRIATFLGFAPSVILSVLWIVALTNAFNFLDNMDGLSAGIAFICAAMFLIAAVFNGQWFICALLLLFMGSVLGFLCFNFPPASIFMGDGGSMVLGFILSVLTIRTTYYVPGRQWYAIFMPLFVMAVPLYDLSIVSVLRLMRGRSPMQGDTNHFSHRLTRHGFSKRGAVLMIYCVTLATGITSPLLARVDDGASAILLAVQLVGMLVVIALLERIGEHTQ
jgi:UDP-GlcNAc:undecaprenyl-phosphate GlcNAc-1-phosphate transferase